MEILETRIASMGVVAKLSGLSRAAAIPMVSMAPTPYQNPVCPFPFVVPRAESIRMPQVMAPMSPHCGGAMTSPSSNHASRTETASHAEATAVTTDTLPMARPR